MDDNSDTQGLEILESKHRREKKELQAQIQALKKVAKNDKTKKKELAIEISRLESELENRHKNEIEAIVNQNSVSCQDSLETNNIEQNKTKSSKAQRRREKKEQQEREREQQIKVQEKENINGPRHVENQSICSKLKEINLKIFSISSDGDCLYKAIAHQLSSKKNKSLSVDELRTLASVYIRENKEDFLPFLCHPESGDMLTDIEFDEYCDKIVNSKVWGGQVEIRALSNSLKCPITIIQGTGLSSIDQGLEFEGSPLIITYHRHMYSLGEHYNSTQNLNDEMLEDSIN